MTVNVLTKFHNVEILNKDYTTILTDYAVPKGYVDQKSDDSKSYTDTKISQLINGAPAALDTLREISDVLGNPDNLAGNLISRISQDETNLANEITRATNAEQTLTNNLSALNTQMHVSSIPGLLDGGLSGRITKEISDRESAVTLVNNAVTAETSRAENAELDLTNQINVEKGRIDTLNTKLYVNSGDGVPDGGLSGRLGTAEADIDNLQTQVTANTQNITALDSALFNPINGGLTGQLNNAKANITALQTEVSDHTQNITALDNEKLDIAGGTMTGLLTASAGLKVPTALNSYLYIGNHWRINVHNNGTSLIFEYNPNPTDEILSPWTTAVPFITSS